MDRFPVGRLVSVLLVVFGLVSLPSRAVAAEELDQANVADTNVLAQTPVIAQTFTVGKSGRLTSVDLWTVNTMGAGPLTVQIRPLNGEAPGSTVLASATVTTNQVGGRVKFAQAPWVIAGERYALVMSTAGGPVWITYVVYGNPYAAGDD